MTEARYESVFRSIKTVAEVHTPEYTEEGLYSCVITFDPPVLSPKTLYQISEAWALKTVLDFLAALADDKQITKL